MYEGFRLLRYEIYSVFEIEGSCVRTIAIDEVFRPILHIEALVRMWTSIVWVWRIVLRTDPGDI